MLPDYLSLSSRGQSRQGVLFLWFFALLAVFPRNDAAAQKSCVFNDLIRASQQPFKYCSGNTNDTIIIRDTLMIDQNYDADTDGGLKLFEGILLVDGGVITWTSNSRFKLGYPAKIVLINGGRFWPGNIGDPGCTGQKTLFFDTKKTANCNGVGAPHAFQDVNNAGCVSEIGICCYAHILATDSSGVRNDRVLCQPGDTAHLSVEGSGALNYSFFWTPNIGPKGGIYPVAPLVTTTYSVQLSAIFDPYGPEPPYLLTCQGSTQIKINPPINLNATTTSTPCAGVPSGSINLTVSGGTPPYTFHWSNNQTTEDLNNIPAGTYTVTVDDSKGCGDTFTATVLVQDNTPPTLSCPANATGISNPGVCTTLIPNINATYSDNCPTVGVTYTLTGATSGSGTGQLSNSVPFSSGVTTVTYKVDDGANAVTCKFTVTVQDNQLPTASNPLPLTGPQCLSAIPAPNPTVVTTEADNCGTPTVTFLSDNVAGGGGCPGDTLIVLRAYRVTDAAGNSIVVTQTIRVVDNLAPNFISVPGNVTVNCQSIPTVGSPAASDNCSGSVTITYNGETRTDGACPDTYTLTRRWTVADNCGNTKTATQTISVQDLIQPAFTSVPANVTVSCDAIPAPGNPAATDNCDAAVAISYDGQTRVDGACPDSYLLKRRWTATDNCGNTKTAEQTIAVQDVTKPAFTFVPANSSANCDAIPAVGTPAASDNCDAAVSIVYNGETRTDGNCPGAYTLTRRWTATDNCGNSASASQTINVQDLTKPSFVNVPASVTVSCDAIPGVGAATATDNCDAAVAVAFLNETRVDGACPGAYTLTRRWIATDDCGNTTTVSQVLTVQDVTKPAFTFTPANTSVSCDAIPAVGTPAASDNCDAAVSIVYNGETRTDGACPGAYTLTRRWTATDDCGNTATTAQALTVQDLTAPVFSAVPAAVTVSCDAIPNVGNAAATDNCDATVTIAYDGQTRTDGTCPDAYTLTRRWIATDDCGNTKTATQLITVRDVTPPAFTFVPPAAVVNCEQIPAIGSPTASDNCDATVTITLAGVTQSTGSCASGGTVIRRWIAADNCGNTATAEQLLTVQDTTKPAFTFVPANLTVACDAVPAPGAPVASDNCTSTVDINYNGETRTNGACPDTYTLTRAWTATDICGNTVTASQTITVRDLAAPAFTFVPANATVECNAVPVAGTPAATDNCDAAVNISYLGETRTDGACPDTYILLRRWTATDNCGNSVSASQTLTVQDKSQPVFSAIPANVTVSCENVPAVAAPVATDNCDAAVNITYLGETRTDGACPDTYTLTRRWTAADNCGNSASAQQTITVQDISKPVFSFVPANVTVNCENVPAVGTPAATDNCDAAVNITYLGETRTDGACPDTYTLLRRWTATDRCGNSTSAEQTLTVRDITKPLFTSIPADVTVECNAVPAVGVPVATDNCDAAVSIVYNGETRSNGNCPGRYQLLRQWTATDACGNTQVAKQSLTVQDNTKPQFSFVPADVTVSCDAVPALGTPTAADNCTAAVALTYSGETRTDGACPDTYVLTRRWVAADECGNTVSAEQKITVQDVVKPKFGFVPANVTVNCQSVPNVGTPTASDNCDGSVTITYDGQTRTDGNCPGNYTLVRRWTAKDNCGNNTSAEQIITVQDVTKPVLAGVPANAVVSCEAIPAVGSPIASDNCTVQVPVVYEGETRVDGACPDRYELFRRWTATDNCGNVASAEQKITVQDATKPVFTSIPASVTVSCENIPAVSVPSATDNCTASVSIVYEGETRTDGACSDTYTLLRRWTATDNCGNSNSATQKITVQDIGKPVFTFVPVDATVSCEAIPSLGAPTASDNCDGDVTILFEGETFTGGNCASGGKILRRWTAVDNCGNSTGAQQLLTIQDVSKPVFTYVPAPLTVNCEAIPPADKPTATDNCTAAVTIAYNGETRIDGACPDTYTLTRRWTAADLCGNSTSVQQVITVQDKQKPVFANVPADATVDCAAVPSVGTPQASDNCDAAVTIQYEGETRLDGPCPDTYLLKRRWTATDNCGNSATVQQTLTVRDITPPTFTFVPASTATSCAAVPPAGTPQATDNCDAAVSIVYNGETRTDGPCLDSYVLRRHWTATDNCGNSVTTEQILTIQDNTPPQFSAVPANTTVNCDAVPVPGTPSATDNCASAITVVYEGETRTDGLCPDSYLLKRRWSATDNCGNVKTAEQIITVRDITAPVFTYKPANVTVSCDAVPSPDQPVATDNCDTDLSLKYEGETKVNASSVSTYQLKRRWTVTDNCGNTASVEQLISVQDVSAPVILCPPNIAVDADAATCSAKVNYDAPVTSDNCSNPVVITATTLSGAVYPIGTTIVKLTAKDDSGNTTTCSFSVAVADTTAPKMSNCPKNITLTIPGNDCQMPVSWTAPTVSDACDSYTIVPVPSIAPGSQFPAGVTPVVYTAKDSTGNVMTCEFSVTVREVVAPVLSNCPADFTINTDHCDALANWTPPQATDNCQLDKVVETLAPGTVLKEGVHPVTYTATDVWGNSTTCSFAITVKDIVPPTFSGCPENMTVDHQDNCSAVVNWDLPKATDNCDAAPKIYAIPAPGDTYPVGHTIVRVFVEDPSGNTDTCKFKITVTGPPIGFVDSPADQSFVGCSAVATWTPPATLNLCAPAQVTYTHSPGDTFSVGVTTVVYTVTDTLGNTGTASFHITVTESIAPKINCPVSPVMVDVSGAVLKDVGKFIQKADTLPTCDAVELEFDLPQATDNCDPPAVAQLTGPASGQAFEVGAYNLEFKTTDAAGNTAMCSVQVEVLPLSPLNPVISDAIGCEGDDITLSTPVIPGAVYLWSGPKDSYPNSNTLLISNLNEDLTGVYTVRALVRGCYTPLDSALVRQAVHPKALDDLTFEVETGALLDSIDVAANDVFELDDYAVTLLTPMPGLTELGEGLFSYQAGADNGHVSFVYQICSKACPTYCDEAAVTITVRETFCSYIPNVITPNGDGINDYLEIPCLNTELYPNNSLIVYNQWGDKVYQVSPYVNDPAQAWQGTLDGKVGEPLPDGTYFYYFQPDPKKSPLSGFIEIFR